MSLSPAANPARVLDPAAHDAVGADSARQAPRVLVRVAGPASARLSAGAFAAVLAVAGIAAVFATDQVVPATSTHQAEMRVWLAARAAGFLALGLLTFQVVIGLVLSHPTNKATWQLSKRLFPWHENAWVFVLAFLGLHVVTIVLDAYAGVGLDGALIPGLSAYRSVPVALGTIALYALLVTGLTARYTKLVPRGMWLKLHRLALVVLALSWTHGILSGIDSVALASVYGASLTLVLAAAAYRYWVSRSGRPTFSTSLPGTHR